jgi:O-antigen/teichoic acid export membrane protein
VSRVGALGATIALSRILVPSEFGQLTIVQTMLTFVTGLAGLGLTLAVTRQVADTYLRSPQAAGRFIGVTLCLTVIGGACATILYLAARRLLAAEVLGSQTHADLIVASSPGVLFAAVAAAAQGCLLGLERFSKAAHAQWIQTVAYSVGLVLGAVVAGVGGALVGYAAGQCVAAAAGYWLLRGATQGQGIPLSYGLRGANTRELWRLGAPAFVAFVAVSGGLLGGQVFLSHQSGGYAEVGAFNAAYRWHLVILFIPGAISPVLLPMLTSLLSQERGLDSRRLFRVTVLVALALTAVPALVMARAAGPILSLNGEFYAGYSEVLVLLAIASVPSALNNVFTSTVLGFGGVKAFLIGDVAFAATFVAVALGEIPAHGASGLALAYLAAYLLNDAGLLLPIRRHLRAMKENVSGGPPDQRGTSTVIPG